MKASKKIYYVNRIDTDCLIINGKGNHEAWNKAVVLQDFQSPWKNDTIELIEFKALYDNENLFFLFKVYDSIVHVNKENNSNNSINNSDRVELFFRTDAALDPYYCIEIDPTPRIMDFKAVKNKQFDFNWNWPKKDISIKSHIAKEFFTVEGIISLDSLMAFKLLNNNIIETGIYRAKYKKQNDGSYVPTWITWVNPNTETPNFHIHSSFGMLKLNK